MNAADAQYPPDVPTSAIWRYVAPELGAVAVDESALVARVDLLIRATPAPLENRIMDCGILVKLKICAAACHVFTPARVGCGLAEASDGE